MYIKPFTAVERKKGVFREWESLVVLHVVIWRYTEALTRSKKIGEKKHIKCHSNKPPGTSAA